MMLRKSVLFLFSFLSLRLSAQVLPKEGSRLDYRLIGFMVPAEAQTGEYRLEIAAGGYSSEDQFAGNIVATEKGNSNKIVAEVPRFGSLYTWRVVFSGKNKGVTKSPFYHFSTVTNARVDTTMTRLRILKSEGSKKDKYVLVEGIGVIYDLDGKPVWSMSDSLFPGGYMVDAKVTPQGTLTFFYKRVGYEATYDGTVLWKMPTQDSICKKVPGSYHHEVARLPNGHHMVLGVEDLKCEVAGTGKDRTIKTTTPRVGYRRNVSSGGNPSIGTFSTLLEFDDMGNLVWSWKSSDYLLKADFAYYTPYDTTKKFNALINSFYFDEQNSAVYVGFKDLSRIVKVAYRSGKVVAVYGEEFKPGVHQKGNGVFCNPHSISRAQDGSLCVYSNNACYSTSFAPAVVLLHEPVDGTDELRKVWEYTGQPAFEIPMGIPESGSARELPDQSFAVCVSRPEYSRLMIVGKDKKVLWSAMPEVFDNDAKRFINPEQYRTLVLSRKDLERMIWGAGKD